MHHDHHRRVQVPTRSLTFTLLCVLFMTLWLAGGASRADAWGQALVRGVSAMVMVVTILFLRPPVLRPAAPVIRLLAAAVALTAAQLVPLPPGIWQSLPDRDVLTEAARVSGQDQTWRPWSIIPSATVNALFSLIVPIATFILLRAMDDTDRARLPGLLLGLVTLAMLVGLLQFSGASLGNVAGEVAGTFANRNHFALFLSMGCLVAPSWVFQRSSGLHMRTVLALGLTLLFILTILASGSRAGLMLGAVATLLGILIVRQQIAMSLNRLPTWVRWALVTGTIAVNLMCVVLSVAADRAVSIQRVLEADPSQDMRRRGLQTVLQMIADCMPFGFGFGSFDPMFRLHEPFGLLKPTYFNHAHNDFLEIILDAGIGGAAILVTAVGWWVWASVRAWDRGNGRNLGLPRLGSAMLLLILLASVFDYPARTPMIMAMVIVAALWLTDRANAEASALPHEAQHL